MKFTNWLARWHRKTEGRKARRGAIRRAHGRWMRLHLETLETRIAPSADPFPQIANDLAGPNGLLTTLQTNLTNALGTNPNNQLGNPIPFIGNTLGQGAGNIVNSFATTLHDALATTPGGASDSLIGAELSGALGGTLAHIGSSAGFFGNGKVYIAHPTALNDSQGNFGIVIEVLLQGTKPAVSTPFLSGLPSLPIQVTANVSVGASFTYELGFQYNANNHVTSFATPGNAVAPGYLQSFTPNPLTVTVSANPTLSGTADFGFAHGSVQTVGAKSENSIGVTFTLNSLDDPTSATLTGAARMHLQLTGGLGSNAEFPSINADFHLDWIFNASSPAPTARFDNVKLDLGTFISGVFAPILNGIQDATAPILPVLDVLTAPLPGISDISNFLGQGDVSLLTLATVVAGQTGYGPLATLVDNLVPIIKDINAFRVANNGEILIGLGGFDLNNTDLRTDVVAGDLNNLSEENLTNLVPDDPSQVNLSQAINKLPPGPLQQDLKKLTQPAANFQFDFPILDNPASAVFGMLLGRDSDLVSVTADVKIDSAGSQASGLSFNGVGFTVGGDVNVDAHLRFAYDTFGLRKVIQDIPNPNRNDAATLANDVLAGFYIDDRSYFNISGDIHAGFNFSFGLVSLGAGGDIGTGNFGHDPIGVAVNPQPQDKLRFTDITLSNFHTFGELDAGLSVTASLGFGTPLGFVGFQHTWGLASVVLLDLDPRSTMPKMSMIAGSIQGGVAVPTPDANGQVTLFVGDLAPMRQVYDFYGQTLQPGDNTDGIGEDYSIADVGSDASGETIDVTAYGITQRISGVKSILAQGDKSPFVDGLPYGFNGQGDLTIDVRKGVTVPVYLYGGAGHADLTYAGSGNSELTAGQQSSTLIGGSGSSTLVGGPAGDELIAGTGFNLIEGGDGNNNIVIQAPNIQNSIISGGDPSRTNTLTVLEPPGSEAIDVTPQAGGSLLQVAVLHTGGGSGSLLVTVNDVTNLVLGAGSGSNSLAVGDLSQTSLQNVYFNNGDATSLSGSTKVVVHGSPGADTFGVSSGALQGNGYSPTNVTVTAPGGKRLSIQLVKLRTTDSLVLAGDGGGDAYNVFLAPNLLAGVTIPNAASRDSLDVSGSALYAGSLDVTDHAVTFKYTDPLYNVLVTKQVNFGPNLRSLTVQAADGSEVVTASRSAGTTEISAGLASGADGFDIGGGSAYTLDAPISFYSTFDIHLPSVGRTTIHGNLSDSLTIDDGANAAYLAGPNAIGILTSYALTAGKVTRTDEDLVPNGGALVPLFNTSSVTFTPMSQVTLDTHTDLSTPDQIDVESTASGTATTIDEGQAGINDVYLSPANQNLDQIAGPLAIAGAGYNRVFVYDEPHNSRFSQRTLAQITVTPSTVSRVDTYRNGLATFNSHVQTINYTGVSEIDLDTPQTALLVEEEANLLDKSTLGQSSASDNAGGYQIISRKLPDIQFGNNLASLDIDEGAYDFDATVDVYDTPGAYPTALHMGSDGVVVVHGTTGPLTIDGGDYGGATSQIFLGDPSPQGGSLAALSGTVTVNGGGGPLALDVDYSGTGYAADALLTASRLRGVAIADVILGAGIQKLTIHTGASPFSYLTVAGSPSGATTTIDGSPNGNTFFVSGTNGPVVVNTGSGANHVYVGSPGDTLVGVSSLTVNGGVGGTTALSLDDSANADGVTVSPGFQEPVFVVTSPTYVITDQSVTRADTRETVGLITGRVAFATIVDTVNYTNVASLAVQGGQSNNVFDVQSTAAGTPTTIDAGSGYDLINLSNAAAVVNADGRLDPIQGSLMIDGQAGVNTLSYAAYQGDVTANLPLGIATDVAGGIRNIQNVIGSQGNDILVGNGGNVLAGGTGRNLLIAGAAASTLVGNSDEDILVGGTTNYDTNQPDLNALMAEWTRTDLPYGARVQDLLTGGGLNSALPLNLSTFHGNGGGNTLTGAGGLDLFYGLLPGDTGTPDKTDWNAPQGEIFIDPNGEHVSIRINAQAVSGAALTLDYYTSEPTATPFQVTLAVGAHLVQTPDGQSSIAFTVSPDGTVSYDPFLEGILTGQGTDQLTVNGAAITINAQAVSGAALTLDYYTSVAIAEPFQVGLLPGAHLLQAPDGQSSIAFTVNPDGTVSYDPTLEGILTGQGTDQLTVNGAAITINAQAVSGAALTLDYYTSVAIAEPFQVGLLPGAHLLQAPDGQSSVAFTVNPDGTVSYDPSLEGILRGQGTNQLTVNGAAVTINAQALTSSSLTLDYYTSVAIAKPFQVGLLPGAHLLQAPDGQSSIAFTVNPDGTVSYDPTLEGILSGRGTSHLTVNGSRVTIDATALADSSLTLDVDTSEPTAAPFQAVLLPGLHLLTGSDGEVSFTVNPDGTISYPDSESTLLFGLGTRTLIVKGLH